MSSYANVRPSPRPVAAYLRLCPADPELMLTCRSDLARLAERHGLPRPTFFEDDDHLGRDEKPALSGLLHLISAGIFRTLLVPGSFVFADAGREARAVVEEIRAAGCVILELSATE
ncbi:recombinase family protein [Kitasatospora sp. NBC_00240]|uniref:recombinase family protein n=1 Tax=Kitasatospora sp. NBC_00240 TaxID=2903567 RepID=UPI00225535E2|nr:recombinase family protein [Kitasatospora sp. NBC_00240]MCX5208402.1 recombinase family protein [Kitasatospora sp. NBC_00240]